MRIHVHRHADLTVVEPVLCSFGTRDASQQRRLGVAQLVKNVTFIALVSCDLLAVYLVGGHVLGEPAETVVDGEVAPLPPVVCLVDEAAELVVEHRCTFCLFDTDGG